MITNAKLPLQTMQAHMMHTSVQTEKKVLNPSMISFPGYTRKILRHAVTNRAVPLARQLSGSVANLYHEAT